MDYIKIKNMIKTKAYEIGIDKIGFAHAEPFYELEKSIKKQHQKNHQSGFEHKILEERIYPDKIFPNPKSIISIALAYPSEIQNAPKRVRGERRGEFARASWGKDYHFILREHMEKLVNYMKDLLGEEALFKPMVDTGELIDVAVAARAGIGFIGKNGLLITKEFGSYVYLGEIITNIPFDPDPLVDYGCGDCRRCIDGCPTQALLGNGEMNAKKCLSYQTQTKNYMPEKYRRRMGKVIYGCDICQIVCPYNQGIDFHLHEEMEPEYEKVKPGLEPMLTISNREFRDEFGEMAGSWRGKKPLQRNAIIALANYRDRSAIPTLLGLIEKDPRPMIRGTSAWAISQIMARNPNQELILFLEEALEKEDDRETIEEFEMAINKLEKKLLNKREGS